MLNKIIDLYQSNQCKDIIFTSEMSFIMNNISEEKKTELNFIEIDDARSATFFAVGRSKVSQKPIMLVLSSESLASSLTGTTEANYQHLPLIIVAIRNTEADVTEECFQTVTTKTVKITYACKTAATSTITDACKSTATSTITDACKSTETSIITGKEENIIRNIKEYLNCSCHKPLLIEIEYKIEQQENLEEDTYLSAVKCVLNNYNAGYQLHLKNELTEELKETAEKREVSVVVRTNRYGVVSNFFGHAVGSKNYCLITTYDKIARDINAFCMNHIKNNVIIIYLKPVNTTQKLGEWFEHNNFVFRKVSSLPELQESINEKTDKSVVIEFIYSAGGEL